MTVWFLRPKVKRMLSPTLAVYARCVSRHQCKTYIYTHHTIRRESEDAITADKDINNGSGGERKGDEGSGNCFGEHRTQIQCEEISEKEGEVRQGL